MMNNGILLAGPGGQAAAKELHAKQAQANMIQAMVLQHAAANMAQMLGQQYNVEIQKAQALAEKAMSEGVEKPDLKLTLDLELMADVAIEASKALLFRLGLISEKVD